MYSPMSYKRKGYTMKKVLKILSVVCLLTAVASLIMCVAAMIAPTKGFFAGYALFNIARGGGFTGFIGNIFGILFTAACFGSMGWYGLLYEKEHSSKKNALIWSLLTSAIGVISVIASVVTGQFNMGDVLLAIIPVFFAYIIIKEA